MKSQRELVRAFVEDGVTSGTASNMYASGDTLYSYGSHFPLLLRMDWGFLLNADKYSSTTSQHQGLCFRHATIQIPFSALHSAGIKPYDIEIIDKQAERWDWTGKYVDSSEDSIISKKEYEKLPKAKKLNYHKHEERRPEAAVIIAGGNYYLSSMDGWNYFLCKLPEVAYDVKDAFEGLMPKEVFDKEYQRQGEWFFVLTDEFPIELRVDGNPVAVEKLRKFFYKGMNSKYTLPNRNPDGNLHIATRGIQLNGDTYVSGQIRHNTRWGERGDHRMLKLSTLDDIKVFKAYENRALGSWSAVGNVD